MRFHVSWQLHSIFFLNAPTSSSWKALNFSEKALVMLRSLILFHGLGDNTDCISVFYGSYRHPHSTCSVVQMSYKKEMDSKLQKRQCHISGGCQGIVFIETRCTYSCSCTDLISCWCRRTWLCTNQSFSPLWSHTLNTGDAAWAQFDSLLQIYLGVAGTACAVLDNWHKGTDKNDAVLVSIVSFHKLSIIRSSLRHQLWMDPEYHQRKK